jgi:hypothetical protein
MDPTFQDWGTIAEIVGGLTVVISLFYVGFQIRQNTRINRGIATQHTFATTQEIYTWFASNPELSELYSKFHQGEILTIPEMSRMYNILLGQVEQYEVYFVLHNLGMMDEETYHGFFKKICLVLGTPAARQWFRDNRVFFRRDFVLFVNTFLDDNRNLTNATTAFYNPD